MDDLGEPVEAVKEDFCCQEKYATPVISSKGNPQQKKSRGILAASSRFGFLIVSVQNSLVLHHLSDLRKQSSVPTVVSLGQLNIMCIESLHFVHSDTAIAVLGRGKDDKSHVFVLDVPSLVSGNILRLPAPKSHCDAVITRPDPRPKVDSSEQMLVTIANSSVFIHMLSEVECITKAVGIAGATCAALAPSDVLLAVGTSRGSVSIYTTADCHLQTTIVEVESGWVPLMVNFVAENALLVSYTNGNRISHVVWEINRERDVTSIGKHSALGELCYSMGNSDDPPLICVTTIPGWDVCFVSSSLSTDVEVVAREDDVWINWKFDEGKSPILPTDENDNDIMPIGLAIDFSDTDKIEANDPSSTDIEPMPMLYVLTSDSMLLPFQFIDYRAGATCPIIQESDTLPKSRTIGAVYSLSHRSGTRPSDDTEEGRFCIEEEEGRKSEASRSLDQSSPARFPDKEVAVIGSVPTDVIVTPQVVTSTSEKSSQIHFPTLAEPLMPPASNFKDVDRLLSTMTFPKANVEKRDDRFSLSSTRERSVSPFREPAVAVAERAPKRIIEKAYLPSVTLETSLEQATQKATEGGPGGILRSIMSEMDEELLVNKQAEQVASEELAEQNNIMLSAIKDIRNNLMCLRERVKSLYKSEAGMRQNVSNTLSLLLSLSREYETMSLEFRVREADGFSRNLGAEEKAADERMAGKESVVLRSLESIEARLNTDAVAMNKKTSPRDLMQQVYSSLSLQGMRVKRVKSLLQALSEQMNKQENGGRLSDLGLSLARLETLGLGDDSPSHLHGSLSQLSIRSSGGRKGGKRCAVALMGGNFEDTTDASVEHPKDDGQLVPSDVRDVLRRLAMRNGREDLSVRTLPSQANTGLPVEYNRTSAASKPTFGQPESFARPLGPSYAVPSRMQQQQEGFVSTITQGNATSGESFGGAEHISQFANPVQYDSESTLNASFASLIPPSRVSGSQARVAGSEQVFVMKTRRGSDSDSKLSPSETIERKRASPFDSESPGFQSPPNRSRGEAMPASRRLELSRHPPGAVETKITTNSRGPSEMKPPAIPGLTSFPKAPKTSNSSEGSSAMFASSAVTVSATAGPKVKRQYSELARSESSESSEDSSDSEDTASGTSIEADTARVNAEFAALPPDSTVGEKVATSELKAIPSFGGEPTNPQKPEVAHLPPDIDTSEKSEVAEFAALPAASNKRTNTPAIDFAALPPSDEGTRFPSDAIPTKASSEFKLPPSESFSAEGCANGDTASHPDDNKKSKRTNSAAATQSSGFVEPSTLSNFGLSLSSALKSNSETAGADLMGSGLVTKDTEDSQTHLGLPSENPVGDTSASGETNAFTPSISSEKSGVALFSSTTQNASSGANWFGFGSESSARFSSFGALGAGTSGFSDTAVFPAKETKLETLDKTVPRVSSPDVTSSEGSDDDDQSRGQGMDTTQTFGSTPSAFGENRSQQLQGFGFGAIGQGLNGPNAAPFGGMGSSNPFASPSQASSFGQTMDSHVAQSFGQNVSTQGSQPSAFGPSSAQINPILGQAPAFGAASPIGAQGTAIGFGGDPVAKFGESSFGGNPFGNTESSVFGAPSSTDGASPFGNVPAGSAFGGSSTGGSGFAALANPANAKGAGSTPLVFGNGGGLPAFTGAAFSQRRG